MSGIAQAIAFLTRLPVRTRHDSAASLGGSVPWLPLVGAGVGLLIALVYVGAQTLFPSFLAAVLAITGGVLLTGAFHEDGLGDVADAFAGGTTPERRLEILGDPRQGTFGVLALALSMLVRVTAVAALDAWSALALVPAAHALSRAGSLWSMRSQPLARPGGLGANYALGATKTGLVVGMCSAGCLAALLVGRWAAPAMVLTVAVSVCLNALANKRLRGITGDVLGSIQQVSELTILLLGVAVLHEGWGILAWWRP